MLVSAFFVKALGARLAQIATACVAVGTFASLVLTTLPVTDFVHTRLWFWLWYPTHSSVVAQYARRDAIITHWDGWGMAGSENDSYLVSNPDDSIGNSADKATMWAKRLKADCDIADATRLKNGLYILTTYNCSL
jgi:hypothetical protein